MIFAWPHRLIRSLRFSTAFGNISVLSIALSFLLILGWVFLNAQELVHRWGQKFQLSVDLHEDLQASQVQDLLQYVRQLPGVARVEHLSQEQTQTQIRHELSQLFPELAQDPEIAKFFPASLNVSLQESQDLSSQLLRLSAEIEKSPAVLRATYGAEWVTSFDKFSHIARWLGCSLSLVLLTTLLALILRSLRDSLSQKQREISVFELVGASPWQIRLPFLWHLFRTLLSAQLIAWLVSFLLYQALAANFPHLQLRFYSLSQILGFLSLSLALIAIPIGWSLRSLNSGWAAREGLEK
ncbi:MAG: permease-like cell division protein FtsX [Bdellovibrio sp.]